MIPRPKFSFVSLVAFVSAVSCLLLLLFSANKWIEHKRNPYNDLAFDVKVWRSAHTEREKELRAKMAGDIIKHYLKVGMTEAQITALLGPPDRELSLEGFAPPDRPDIKEIYQYDMGQAWGDFQNENLRIWFDTKGHYLSSYTQVD